MRLRLLSVLLLVLTGCKNDKDCAVGAEGCDCTPGGSCDPGLSCLSNICVNDNPGDASLADLPRAGDGATGDLLKPPPVTACSNSSECKADEVCGAITAADKHCLEGSGKSCGTPPACIKNQGFDGTMMECSTAADCGLNEMTIQQVCIDSLCLNLCQYHDDPSLIACATDPQVGLNTKCSRNHVRALVAAQKVFACGSEGIATAQCPTPTPSFSSAFETFIACVLDKMEKHATCYEMLVGSNNCHAAAGLDIAGFLDELKKHLTITLQPKGSSGGSGCSTDCDCGKCWYCEKSGGSGTCRYGGEGPYGCYRGCN